VWIVEAYKDGKRVSRGSFWFGQNTGLGTSPPDHLHAGMRSVFEDISDVEE